MTRLVVDFSTDGFADDGEQNVWTARTLRNIADLIELIDHDLYFAPGDVKDLHGIDGEIIGSVRWIEDVNDDTEPIEYNHPLPNPNSPDWLR